MNFRNNIFSVFMLKCVYKYSYLWIWQIKSELSESQAEEIGAQINNFPVGKTFSWYLFRLWKRIVGITDYTVFNHLAIYRKNIRICRQITKIPFGFAAEYRIISIRRIQSSPRLEKAQVTCDRLHFGSPLLRKLLLLVWRLCGAVQMTERHWSEDCLSLSFLCNDVIHA